eukprot:NODE_982_length_2794_cov_0.358442.p3 type:complete len:196 gc:universal NODE_982_length_2794_cov_0.358442:52-639(+)
MLFTTLLLAMVAPAEDSDGFHIVGEASAVEDSDGFHIVEEASAVEDSDGFHLVRNYQEGVSDEKESVKEESTLKIHPYMQVDFYNQKGDSLKVWSVMVDPANSNQLIYVFGQENIIYPKKNGARTITTRLLHDFKEVQAKNNGQYQIRTRIICPLPNPEVKRFNHVKYDRDENVYTFYETLKEEIVKLLETDCLK